MKVEHHTHMAEYPIVVRMSKKEFEVLKEAVKYGAAWLDENGYSVESADCCEMNEIFAKEPEVHGVPYEEIVEAARQYIIAVGGFEKFAEWGLIRPGM